MTPEIRDELIAQSRTVQARLIQLVIRLSDNNLPPLQREGVLGQIRAILTNNQHNLETHIERVCEYYQELNQ